MFSLVLKDGIKGAGIKGWISFIFNYITVNTLVASHPFFFLILFTFMLYIFSFPVGIFTLIPYA